MTNPVKKRVVTLDDLNVLNQNAAYARQKGEVADAAATRATTAAEQAEQAAGALPSLTEAAELVNEARVAAEYLAPLAAAKNQADQDHSRAATDHQQVADSLAGIAQAQAEQGLIAVPNEAALPGKPAGGYRVLATNERVYYDGAGNITARAPMAAADALAARVYRVPLQAAYSYTQNAQVVQSIIALAPAGSTLQFPADGVRYQLGPVPTITKTLDIDLTGTLLDVDLTPTPGSANGSPLIRFAASYGADLALTACTTRSTTITLANAADAAGLSVGDWVTVHDAATVPRWDGGVGYGYRYELNQIKAIAGATLTLTKPLRWPYSVTPQVTRVINPINQPKIYGAASISELDPGVAFSGTLYGPNCPHLFAFEGCLQPQVSDCRFDGWNVHAVNFHLCLTPRTLGLQGNFPFRPENGGLGYLVKFMYTSGGYSGHGVSNRVRHHVDCTQAYDVVTEKNRAYDNTNIAYNMHGLGSQDCKSIDDECYGAFGWVSGNASFAADYNFQIIRPKYRGTGIPVQMQTLSEGMEIVDPDFVTTARPILMTTGARGLKVRGGTLDARDSLDSGVAGVLVREKIANADPFGITPADVEVIGTTIRLPDTQGTVIGISATGTVRVENNTVQGGLTQINVSGGVPTDLYVRRNRHGGGHQRSAQIQVEPTGRQIIEGNSGSGMTVYSYGFTPNARTTYRGNHFPTGPFVNGADLDALSTQGLQFTGNLPLGMDRLPPFVARLLRLLGLTLDGDGTGNVDINFTINGALRAILRMGTTGDLLFVRRNNDGSAAGTWLTLNRSTGAVTVENGWQNPLILQYSLRLWRDAGNRLRTKGSGPANDTDGAVLQDSSNGSTASRPAAPARGQQYFDTTLNKPIWCRTEAVSGGAAAVWVDAAGVTV